MDSRRSRAGGILAALLMIVLVACSGGTGATPSPSEEASAEASATPEESVEATPEETPSSDEVSIEGPPTVEAGADFEVEWTGPDNEGDFIAIIPLGATEWTATDDYFYTLDGSPGELKAPTGDGEYELAYFNGEDEAIVGREPITVTPFTGSLLAPDEVGAGSVFEVAWNGPDGSGDYVTIMEVGVGNWSGEDFFYTGTGSPGELVAPIKAGAYEIRYISGTGAVVQATLPITVLELVATVDGPEEVSVSELFDVAWTGPDGPGDYVTIVPVGSPPNTYLSYFYTGTANPGELLAPTTPGEYELWYVTGTEYGIFAREPITVVP